jgi:hypothetical protein
MAAVSSERLLRAWEATVDEQPLRRGISLLASYRAADVRSVAEWSVLARDRALYDLRCELFGAQAVAIASCPRCQEQLEVPLDLARLRPPVDVGIPEPVHVDGYVATVRIPTTVDLLGIGATADEDHAAEALVARCVDSIRGPDGKECTLHAAPASVRSTLRLHLAELLDDVDIELELRCATCDRAFAAPFDIAPFLLREIEAWAATTLRDIHEIARAYGWDEPTILALSPHRRRRYLDLIQASR